MRTYDVTIKAVVTKTYTVHAEDKDTAEAIAWDRFSFMNDAAEEDVDYECLEVVEVEE